MFKPSLRSSDNIENRPHAQFEGDNNGQASEFERSLALARYLAGTKLRDARTIAFVPDSLYGHAVLVALACSEIIIGREAEFGAAGVNAVRSLRNSEPLVLRRDEAYIGVMIDDLITRPPSEPRSRKSSSR